MKTMQEPRIITRESFKVVGMQREFTLNSKEIIAQLWGDFMQRAGEIKNRVDMGVSYGICEMASMEQLDNYDDNTPMNELVCVEVSNFNEIPEGMVSKTIPTLKYAIFTHKGLLVNLPQTYDYIYNEWFPKSGYKAGAPFDIELYDERFNFMSPESSEIDIYMPIA